MQSSADHRDDQMMLIQANIDDMNPEFCSYVMDGLFLLGANDVFLQPIIMKKGRPGYIFNVLISRELQVEAERYLFSETTTLGLRYHPVTCHRLQREFADVSTRWGTVHVKLGFLEGKRVQYAPEFVECEAIAKEYGIPLKEVYAEVQQRFVEMES